MNTNEFQFLRRLALAAVIALVVICAWLAPLDTAANQQVDAGLKRALVSFATARAINAVISVAQGTEIAFQPAGVGVILTPGQLLDPLNELIEEFSKLMLAASIAFGIQKVLLGIGAHWLASSLLSAVALAWGVLYFGRRRVPPWLSRILLVLLMIRFAIPVVTLGSDLLFREFMAADYQASQQAIDLTSHDLATLRPPDAATADKPGTLEAFKGWWSQNADLKAQFNKLTQAVEQAAEHIIKLMVIFLLQTLVIPLLLLWALYALSRGLFALPAGLRPA